ncbi:DUF6174 domain-containing protein [Nostoc sp.]|uniref:DUF6174 domain-containing protein n=1 Tax=Nostoc sp. TaxID=1180 RepID=UPI002FFAF7E0
MRLPIAIGAFLVASLSLSSQVMSESPTQIAQTSVSASYKLGQLKTNQRLWNRQKIFNYRYTLSNNCFCIPEFRGPVIIEVRNGITTSIKSVNTGKAVNLELLKKYTTIPKLFNLIKNTINSTESELTVQYNPKLGYPTQINIGNLAADAGVFTTVVNFQEIP